jgi:hypothetical protein
MAFDLRLLFIRHSRRSRESSTILACSGELNQRWKVAGATRKGNYILYSLFVFVLCAAMIGFGGGFGATKMYKFDARIPSDKLLTGALSSQSHAIGTPAASNIFLIKLLPISGEAFTMRPKTTPLYDLGKPVIRSVGTPAATNIFVSSRAYEYASASPRSCSIRTSNVGAFSRRAAAIWADCSGVMCLHAVNRSNSAVRSRASAASFSKDTLNNAASWPASAPKQCGARFRPA